MSHREDPLRRGRVIRRRKGEAAQADAPPPSPAAAEPPPPARAAQPAAPPARPAPAPAPAPPPARPSVDKDALLAEIENLSMDDLASLLGGGAPRQLVPGDRVEGTVVRITFDSIFLDVGAKSEAVFDAGDFEGRAAPRVGDTLTGFVASAGHRGIRLTRSLAGEGAFEALEAAAEDGTPVDGRVESRNPGGFVIKIGSIRAFCPISQISRLPAEDPDSWLGRTLPFRVVEIKERDIVVSHRKVEEAAAESEAATTWATLEEGDTRSGVVTGVKDFGAFVDIGGVRGLVPRREFGWGFDSPAPKVGTRVDVRVLSVDRDARRVSLSLRDPGARPWSRVGVDFVEGGRYPAKVSRLTDFGAFVALAPGLEGLVHVSKMSDERVASPSAVVSVGQTVDVTILAIDHDRERLQLSMREDDAEQAVAAPRKPAAKQPKQSLGTFGDLFSGIKLP
jgi:small subunit ribosomal protein S1